MGDEPKWKKFEKLVASVQAELAPDAHVTQNENILGQLTGVKRQIDIAIRKNIGQFPMLIVIDCKDHELPLDVKGVEEFIGLVKDVGANQGAIVAANGFTETAKTRASKAGIELFRLVDIANHDWQASIKIPIVVEDASIGLVEIELLEPQSIRGNGHLNFLPLYDKSGKILGGLTNYLRKVWNDGIVPDDVEAHTIEFPLATEPLFIEVNGALNPISFKVTFHIKRDLRLNMQPLSRFKGLENQVTGALSFRSIGLNLDVDDIATWKQIESLEELATSPIIVGMRSFYSIGDE